MKRKVLLVSENGLVMQTFLSSFQGKEIPVWFLLCVKTLCSTLGIGQDVTVCETIAQLSRSFNRIKKEKKRNLSVGLQKW